MVLDSLDMGLICCHQTIESEVLPVDRNERTHMGEYHQIPHQNFKFLQHKKDK